MKPAPVIKNLGLVPYEQALALMDEFHNEVVANASHPGYILTVEHPSVVTMGNRDTSTDLLQSAESLAKLEIAFAKIDRGGSVTVHEPGQIVVYPILRLDTSKLTVKRFVWLLEEAMIQFCQAFNVTAVRDEQYPGVWVGQNKIGALGIRIKNFVSKHGLAFNHCNSLAAFRVITPCGIRDRGVTTLEREVSQQRQMLKTDFPNFSIASQRLAGLLNDLLQANT